MGGWGGIAVEGQSVNVERGGVVVGSVGRARAG